MVPFPRPLGLGLAVFFATTAAPAFPVPSRSELTRAPWTWGASGR